MVWETKMIFHHGPAQPQDHWPTVLLPVTGFCEQSEKKAEVSSTASFVLGTVYRFPHLEVDTSRQLVRCLLPSQIPPGNRLGARQPGMPLHRTDVCTRGLREWQCRQGEMTCGFSSAKQHCPCSEMWHSLGIFQILNFKLFHLSEELASASRLFAAQIPSAGFVSSLGSKRPWLRDLHVSCAGTRVLADLLLICWS